VEQKSRREDVLNQILLLLNTAIGRIKNTDIQKHNQILNYSIFISLVILSR
jgi:hypothetical protein